MKQPRGFTLIEVLVVLVIVGLMAALLSIDIGGLQLREDERELRRLRLAIEASREHAQIGGSPVMIELTTGGYRFAALDFDGNWRPLNHPPLIADRRLSADWHWGGVRQAYGVQGGESRLILDESPSEFRLRVLLPIGEALLLGHSDGRIGIVMPDGKAL